MHKVDFSLGILVLLLYQVMQLRKMKYTKSFLVDDLIKQKKI